jgi:hypothetical protein
MNTQTVSLDNAEDVTLATECIEWHNTNCAKCMTGEICTGAAENMAFLEGIGFSEHAPKSTVEARVSRPAAGSAASNQYGTSAVHYATDKQFAFLRNLLAQRDMSNVTERQAAFLARVSESVATGSINKRHASDAIEILLALPVHQDATVKVDGPSEKQIAFAAKLISERVTDLTVETFKSASKREASKMIDSLLSADRKPVEAKPADVELSSGIYRVNDSIYKVYRGQSGRMLAKLLMVEDEGSASFEYQGMATRFVKAGTSPMTLDEAKDFGAIYGVCCNCGRTLTDEGSIEAGIGPVCAKTFI